MNHALNGELPEARFYVGLKVTGDKILSNKDEDLGDIGSINSQLNYASGNYVTLSGDYELYSSKGTDEGFFLCQHY